MTDLALAARLSAAALDEPGIRRFFRLPLWPTSHFFLEKLLLKPKFLIREVAGLSTPDSGQARRSTI